MFPWLQYRVKQTCRLMILVDQPAKLTCFRFNERPCLQPCRWQEIEERHATSTLGLYSWAHVTYQRQRQQCNTHNPPTCTCARTHTHPKPCVWLSKDNHLRLSSDLHTCVNAQICTYMIIHTVNEWYGIWKVVSYTPIFSNILLSADVTDSGSPLSFSVLTSRLLRHISD